MKMINLKSIFRLSLTLGLLSNMVSPCFADQEGTSTATFLRIGQGARAEGMGGAYTAIADDAHAVYWNPAGLAQITRRSLALNHLQYIEKINSQNAAVVLPFNRHKGSLGIAATYVNYGTIERRDASGVTSGGSNDVTSYAATVSWGQALGDQLALGFGGKFFNQDLAGETGSGFALDLGILGFVIPNRLALAATALNVGPKVKTGTTDENIPQLFRGGVSYYAVPEKLVLALDLEKERDTDATLRLGGEYTFQKKFILRAGYQDTQEAGGGLSAGAGFIWRPQDSAGGFFGSQDTKSVRTDALEMRFDYAYVDLGDFDSTHRLGLHLLF